VLGRPICRERTCLIPPRDLGLGQGRMGRLCFMCHFFSLHMRDAAFNRGLA
jgi:hypothetical protein